MITRLAVLFLLIAVTLTGHAQDKELSRLADAAAKAEKKGLLTEADSLYGQYILLFRERGLAKDFQYSDILIRQARRAVQKGYINEAIDIQQEVIEVRKTAQDCTFLQWASAMSDLGSFYSLKGDYAKAIEIGQTALEMLKKKIGEKHHYYNIVLANLASYHSARGWQGDYEKAIALGEKALKGLRRGSREYAGALNSMVVYYSQVGDKANAIKIAQKARIEAKKWLKEDGVSYATTLNNHAIQLAKVGNYEEAVRYASQAKEGFEIAGVTQSLGYTKVLNNMGTFYSHLQNYKDAAQVLETAIPIIEQVATKQHPDYLRCMSDLSSVYKASGNLSRADQLANESNAVSQTLTGDDNLKYAKSLSKQAGIFASNGNYIRAIELEQKAFDFYKKHADSVSMAQSLGHMATFLARDGHQDAAFETARRSLTIFEQQGKRTTYYAQALNNTSILYFNGGKNQEATTYGSLARQMYEHLGDTATAIYARILANNALFCYVNDSLEQAINIAEQALALQTNILGSDHPDHVPLLYNLSVYYSKAGRKTDAEDHYKKAIRLQSELIRTDFLHLTSQEREKFWNQKSYVFKYAPMLAYLDPDNGDMATTAYNALLFQKGILLNSDIDFRKLLKQSNSQSLLNKYNELEILQQQLEGYYRLPAGERHIDLKAIKAEIYNLERILVNECKEYGRFTDNLSINAEQISQVLNDDEVAIEFANTYIQGRGNTYLAFMLKKGQPQPRLIRLFSDDELQEITYGKTTFLDAIQTTFGIDSIYRDRRFGSLLWASLIKEMKGVRRIYFSPTGLFYHLGIEYLPCDSVHHINDLFDVYRISSTKLLANRGDKQSAVSSATVYGGLNYNMDLSQLQQQHEQFKASFNSEQLMAMTDTDMTRTLDSLSLRGSVGYLPGTLHEAENIGEQLMQKDIPTRMLLGNEGTEESFKALNGQKMSIIHIATHGFYFSEKELQKRRQRLIFLNEESEDMENPLNYSGLLLSGANYILKGGKLPKNLEDGVMTANEIAQIDLSQTDLVVLSACQTGVGDIREDGVFGIQRGFKKAGVRSLLMSLWSVSDQATDLMMTKFYDFLLAGLPKPRAFQAAQKSLRESGYDSPFYWASFILLDGF